MNKHWDDLDEKQKAYVHILVSIRGCAEFAKAEGAKRTLGFLNNMIFNMNQSVPEKYKQEEVK